MSLESASLCQSLFIVPRSVGFPTGTVLYRYAVPRTLTFPHSESRTHSSTQALSMRAEREKPPTGINLAPHPVVLLHP